MHMLTKSQPAKPAAGEKLTPAKSSSDKPASDAMSYQLGFTSGSL